MKLNRSRLFYGSLHWLKLKGQWECWVALCVCMYMCVYEVSFVCVFLQVSACVCVYSIQAVNPSFYPLLFFLIIGFLFTVCTCEHAFCLTSSQFSRGLWCSGWLALCQSIRSSLCCVCSPPPPILNEMEELQCSVAPAKSIPGSELANISVAPQIPAAKWLL